MGFAIAQQRMSRLWFMISILFLQPFCSRLD